ncbi:MAG: histidine kinase dimerization/phospho-acceptor domain-containing protein, partial [Pyrinomonadaceae bacterium]
MNEENQTTDSISPEGQVVYRRSTTAGDSDQRGSGGNGAPTSPKQMAPSLTPLLMGFALLLFLILVLGYFGVRKIEDTSGQVLEMEHEHASMLSLLLQLRVGLTRLDNEARDRAAAEARQELRPPFDLRLSTARNEVNRSLALFERSSLAQTQKWRSFHGDLDSYFEVTDDLRRYSLEGFDKFKTVDKELDVILSDTADQEGQILQRSEAMQGAAARAIRFWTFLAILAGCLIAFGTITEIQRRFRQLRSTTEDARREREFSNQMLAGMVSAVAAIDGRNHIRSANPAFFKMFPGATIGVSLYERFAPDDAMKMLEAATASRVEEATYRGRSIIGATEDNGGARTFDVYSSPLAIDGEQGQILTLVDVTEAAQAEVNARKSEALAAVGQAAAQLAHEIKNPLGSIRLGVAMLRDSAPNEDALNTITLVERGIMHLNKLVVDVTEFSRGRPLELAEVDLKDLIESSVELVADRVDEKQTPIELNLATEDIRGNWDAHQLRGVFMNLLANAIDASSPGAPVTVSTEMVAAPQPSSVSTESSTSMARIVISDRGAGIDDQTR